MTISRTQQIQISESSRCVIPIWKNKLNMTITMLHFNVGLHRYAAAPPLYSHHDTKSQQQDAPGYN